MGTLKTQIYRLKGGLWIEFRAEFLSGGAEEDIQAITLSKAKNPGL